MAEGLEERSGAAARLQRPRAVNQIKVADGDEVIGGDEEQSSMKPGLRHADDGHRMLVDQHGAAHYRAVVLEAGVPVGVSEHHKGCARITMFIGAVVETAQIWLDS
jgi:hypothetical protein